MAKIINGSGQIPAGVKCRCPDCGSDFVTEGGEQKEPNPNHHYGPCYVFFRCTRCGWLVPVRDPNHYGDRD